MRRLSRAGAVVFDCDSTLTAVEGIDQLAADRREQVAALTDAAMRGDVPLDAVYGRRLELIRPRRESVDELARRYVDALVPDAPDVIAALKREGMHVRIMSGGLTPAVLAVAAALGVDARDVAAVDIAFADDGAYAGYDATSPLARAGGKRELLLRWRDELRRPILFVGDGATDLEAADVADVFIAYAGIVARDAVVAGADVVIRNASLAPVLPLALAGEPPHAENRALHERGLSLLDEDTRSRLIHATHETE